MLALSILAIFIILVIIVIIIEIRNEKKYQETRRQRGKTTNQPSTNIQTKRPHHTTLKQEPPTLKDKNKEIEKEKLSKKPLEEKIKLPTCNYSKFTHIRLLEMGLSDEEAQEFIQELISQIEVQIPLIKEVLEIPDFHQMERLTHSIKGSATNLGTGGISDLLVEYNTYLKKQTNIDIAKTYFEYLVHYTGELKQQYT